MQKLLSPALKVNDTRTWLWRWSSLTCTKAVICPSLCVRLNSHPGFSAHSFPDLCWRSFVSSRQYYRFISVRTGVRWQTLGLGTKYSRVRKKRDERKKERENVLITRQLMFVSRCVWRIVCVCALYMLVLWFLSLLSIYVHWREF